MTARNWQVLVARKARAYWDSLGPDLQDRIERELTSHPFMDPERPWTRKHLKGKIKGKNRRCNREYRLGGGSRIFYTVDEERREIVIVLGGPHP